ncbi:DUF423 domain-containing protein [Methylobacterium platani]|uniref:Uncharacterized protein n=2 Tax=Methylobacterium platani TaxID=427683 RepID=A0A179S594_9HYPH|nr:DUF423 domain-containing protein [Methylobacterium platani]KMO15730.1 hypothetical protein SQ03_16650 [Methylobacterium platani JCM 14648]OAS21014.1 hypothetical protein A5481_21275 [Methylobacterium platani]
MHPADRALVALAGLAGALGVGLSAAAAHIAGATSLATAAQFLLFHAPALLALALLSGSGRVHPAPARAAGLALALGLALFSGDLSARALMQAPLFPMAAPSGGMILILGWILVAVAAAWPARR